MRPPYEVRGQSDVFRVLDRDILRSRQPAEAVAVFAWVSPHDSNLRKVLTVSLTDIKNVSGAEACDAGRLLFLVLEVFRLASHDGGENHDALLAFLDEATELVPSAEASNMACIGLLQGDEQNVVQAVAVKPSNSLEIAGKRLAVTLLQGSDELLGGLLRDFLDLFCFRFRFRSPVRGFGPLTRSRGTKEPRLQENGRRKFKEPGGGQPA
jgi:hypothetical protein